MNIKSVALLALLTPCLALLAGCNHDNTRSDMDDMSTPSSDMPADSMSGTTTSDSSMSSDTSATTGTSTMPPDSSMTTAGTTTAFADLDSNHDGSLSQDEVSADADLSANFSTADSNGDGVLSEAEVTQQRASSTSTPTP